MNGTTQLSLSKGAVGTWEKSKLASIFIVSWASGFSITDRPRCHKLPYLDKGGRKLTRHLINDFCNGSMGSN
jgi:hypothetical protein